MGISSEDWRNRWPNHCRECGGWGRVASPDEDFICYAYYDWRICHRCGRNGLLEDGTGPCKVCGWNYDDGLSS